MQIAGIHKMSDHDLLVKIRVDAAFNNSHWIGQALRAVVELHKTQTETFCGDEIGDEPYEDSCCVECPDDEFPCATLQAIMDKLK